MLKFNSDYELVKFVAEKLDKQGCKSFNNAGACAYRGVNGARCAAGWILDDGEFTEGSGVELKFFDNSDTYLTVARLQKLHDLFWKPDDFESFTQCIILNNPELLNVQV